MCHIQVCLQHYLWWSARCVVRISERPETRFFHFLLCAEPMRAFLFIVYCLYPMIGTNCFAFFLVGLSQCTQKKCNLCKLHADSGRWSNRATAAHRSMFRVVLTHVSIFMATRKRWEMIFTMRVSVHSVFCMSASRDPVRVEMYELNLHLMPNRKITRFFLLVHDMANKMVQSLSKNIQRRATWSCKKLWWDASIWLAIKSTSPTLRRGEVRGETGMYVRELAAYAICAVCAFVFVSSAFISNFDKHTCYQFKPHRSHFTSAKIPHIRVHISATAVPYAKQMSTALCVFTAHMYACVWQEGSI